MNGRQNKQKQKPTWFDLNEDKALGVLIDYYNLRLQITQEDGKLTLSDKEFQKITDFFMGHLWLYILPPVTAKKFDEKYPHDWVNSATLKELHDRAAQANSEERWKFDLAIQADLVMLVPSESKGLSHPFADWNWVLWRESEGFQEFLSDYQRITAIVKDTVVKKILSPESYRWIENFGTKVHSSLSPKLNHKPKSGNWGDYWECYTIDGEIDLKKANIIERPNFLHKWYGADFGRFVYFLYKGLLQLHSGEVGVKPCASLCCEKIFAVSKMGKGKERKWCGGSCRVKAHRRKNLKKTKTKFQD